MVSSIDDTVGAAATAQARPTPSPTIVAEPWITVPTPATEHAPRGHVVNESARGTIFWEAEPEQIRETRETEDETTATEKAEPEIDQRSLGRPFKIQWLSTEKLPFHQTRGLRNPWNQNRDVKIARDGTEIEPSVGRRLVNLFHSNQVATAPPAGPQLLQRIGHPSMPSTAYTPDPRFRQPY
jgi:YT521-B-like domain